jgi:hypothetical protein
LLPVCVHSDVFVLVLWHIWKARNALIFYHKPSSATQVLRQVVNNMSAWSCRYQKMTPHWNCWRDFLCSRL